MNHAGIAPLPRRVADEIRAFADEALLLDRAVYVGWERRAEEVRARFAQLIGARPAEVAFVRNTSEGLSLVAAGLPWQAGDNVIALADEYPSNVYPWFGLRRQGVETRLLARPALRYGVDDVRPLVDAQTRLLAVSAVDWQSGFRADLAALGEFCRSRGILLCVDGIQAVGALRVDVRSCGVHFFAAGGHKWLLAPEGCGALYVAGEVIDRLQPALLGWKSVSDADNYLPYHFDLRSDAARLEPGTAQHLGIRALGAAIDLLLDIGPGAIEARVLELTAELAAALRERGATILSPGAAGERSGILTVSLGETAALHQALTEAGVVVRQRLGGVRFAPHFYNDAADLARVLAAVDGFIARR